MKIAWIVFCALALGMAWLSNQGLLKANAELRQENTKLKSALGELSAADARLKAADLVLKGNCSGQASSWRPAGQSASPLGSTTTITRN